MPVEASPFMPRLSEDERAFVDALTAARDHSITWDDMTMTIWRGAKWADFPRPLHADDVQRVMKARFKAR